MKETGPFGIHVLRAGVTAPNWAENIKSISLRAFDGSVAIGFSMDSKGGGKTQCSVRIEEFMPLLRTMREADSVKLKQCVGKLFVESCDLSHALWLIGEMADKGHPRAKQIHELLQLEDEIIDLAGKLNEIYPDSTEDEAEAASDPPST